MRFINEPIDFLLQTNLLIRDIFITSKIKLKNPVLSRFLFLDDTGFYFALSL